MDIVNDLQEQHRGFIEEAVRIQKEVDQAHLNVSVEQAVRAERERIWSALVDIHLDDNRIEDIIFNPGSGE